MTIQKNKKAKRALRYTGFVLVTLLLIGLTCTAICGVAFAYYIKTYVSSDVDIDLDSFRLNFTSFIYYIDKETGQEVELEQLHGTENRVWADIEEIPQMLQDAFISVEDARFKTHHGVDWKRTIGAALNYVVKFRDNFGGGSTITQQLIKNKLLTTEKSYKRKIQEMSLALQLEKVYSKDQILEAYLNSMPLGGRNYGVKAAALDYFGKGLDELTLRECACLAGVTQYPWLYNPRRAMYVTGKMDQLPFAVIDIGSEVVVADLDQVELRRGAEVGLGNAEHRADPRHQDEYEADREDFGGCQKQAEHEGGLPVVRLEHLFPLFGKHDGRGSTFLHLRRVIEHCRLGGLLRRLLFAGKERAHTRPAGADSCAALPCQIFKKNADPFEKVAKRIGFFLHSSSRPPEKTARIS